MHPETKIRKIQAQQGWTDETLLAVTLDFITTRKEVVSAFLTHLELFPVYDEHSEDEEPHE